MYMRSHSKAETNHIAPKPTTFEPSSQYFYVPKKKKKKHNKLTFYPSEAVRDTNPVGAGADIAAMISTNSDFVDFILPLRERLALYDRSSPPAQQPKNDTTDPAKSIPQGFIDAMMVREEVFVKEQGVALENELDFDDRRCL